MIQGAASAPRIAILQVRVTSWISFNDVFLPGVLIRVAYGSVFSHNHRRLATVFDLKGSMANFYVALPIYSLRRTPGKFLKASRMVIHIDPNSPLDDSMGALYIGTTASAILKGVCLLQVFLYFQKYKQDPWYIKAAVIIVATFDMIQLFLAVICIYYYVITNFHDPSKLQYLFRPVMIEALFIGGTGGIVQVFYTYRIWCLSKHNWLLSSLILLFICGEFGMGITWVSSALQMKMFSELLKITPLIITTNVLSCSVDILIAGCLCILLHRARTGLKRTDSIINKLILFGIGTGLLTTIFAIIVFICILASPYSLIYGSFYLCLGPLYTNSFLTTLNSRSTIVAEIELNPSGTTSQAFTLSGINFRIETIHEGTVRDEEQAAEVAWATVSLSKINGHDVLLVQTSEDDTGLCAVLVESK